MFSKNIDGAIILKLDILQVRRSEWHVFWSNSITNIRKSVFQGH